VASVAGVVVELMLVQVASSVEICSGIAVVGAGTHPRTAFVQSAVTVTMDAPTVREAFWAVVPAVTVTEPAGSVNGA
jgi:hypothetical protein